MLELADIHKAYGTPDRPVPVLHDVSVTVGSGEFCAILGPSGCGKSTLLNIIGMLDRPDGGQMTLAGQAIDIASQAEAARLRNRMIGFVFQSFQLLPRMSAWQNVALPLLYRGVNQAERQPLALAMLDRVGLGNRADHLPTELSGGQRQRVALARALIGAPKILLADEPTGSLDSVTGAEVMALFRQLNHEGVTIIMVTHDRQLADQCNRQIEMLDGRIIADRRAI